jgi:predicted aspartyl protease
MQRLVSLVAVVASFAAMPLPVAADDAAALVAKHAAFVGWKAGDGSITTLVLEGVARDNRGAIVVERSEIREGRLSHVVDASTSRNGVNRGFTGRLYWSSDANGFTIPTIGKEAAFLTSRDIVFDEATALVPATLGGSATVDGVATQILHFEPQGGLPFDVYVDPATGAYKRAVIGATSIDLLAYADALPGKKIVSSWRVDNGEVWTYEKIVANAVVALDEFHPPAARATWSFAEDTPYPILIDANDRHKLFIDATVNGVLGHFILDTGAAGIFLSGAFAKKAGVKRLGATEVSGIGQSALNSATRVELDSVGFGANVLHDVRAVADIDELSENGDARGRDGAIGFPLFAAAIVQLDLDKSWIKISPPGSVDLDSIKGITLVGDLSDGTIVVPAKLNGRASVDALLDTGSPLWVLVSSKFLYDHGLTLFHDSSRTATNIEFSGAGKGSMRTQCGELQSVDFGPVHYSPAPACETDAQAPDEPVIVGLDFLKNFNFYFDYPESKIILVPRS